MENLKSISWLLSIVLVCLSLTMNMCVNSKINSIQKDNKEIVQNLKKLQDSLTNLPTKVILRKELEQNMYKFLIFEEDVDKKKVSLSEIQMKLEK